MIMNTVEYPNYAHVYIDMSPKNMYSQTLFIYIYQIKHMIVSMHLLDMEYLNRNLLKLKFCLIGLKT